MAKKNKTSQNKAISPAWQEPVKIIEQKKNTYLSWLLSAVAITVICFLAMLQNGFTNWDDDNYVLNNALLQGPDWKGIFTTPVSSNYHPLTIISFAFNYAISATNPFSYLLVNLLLHAINTALVFIFIYRLSNEKKIVAFFTALVFGIHPMHVESVAWVSERKDVLYAFFFLLSLLQYWKYLQTEKQTKLWLCFLFFVLSLLSKPAAIILPLTLFLLDYWQGRTISKKLIIEKIPFFLAALAFAIITVKVQSATAITSTAVYSLWMRFFFACYGIMIYSIRFFIPYPLSAFHPFPMQDNVGWEIYISPLFVLALLFLVWRFRKNKVVVFGFLFFLFNLLLVLQFVSVGLAIVAERYTYMPYAGIAFLIAMIAEKFISTTTKTYLMVLAVVTFFAFAFITFQQTKVWKDSNTLWTNVIEHDATAALPRAKRAEYNYNKAISPNPGDTTALLRNVITDCTTAIENDTGSTRQLNEKQQRNLYYMRGIAYNYLGEYENAFKDFSTYLIFNPNDNKILFYRGAILVNYYKKYEAAIDAFNKAIAVSPQGLYYLNRSICYFNLGYTSNAKADAAIALQKGTAVPVDYFKLLGL